jgi:NitT/TauT family transport system substrate-binding protein
MLHTYAARLFTKAAQDKDPEIIKIISDATKVPERLITAAAPRWTWYDENGMPNVESADAQFNFVSQTMRLVTGKVTREALFDLGPAKEAAELLNAKNPFL